MVSLFPSAKFFLAYSYLVRSDVLLPVQDIIHHATVCPGPRASRCCHVPSSPLDVVSTDGACQRMRGPAEITQLNEFTVAIALENALELFLYVWARPASYSYGSTVPSFL